MIYQKCTKTEYDWLNDMFSQISNYDKASVQKETGTTTYAESDPSPYYFDADNIPHTEQNEAGDLEEGYLFPIGQLQAQVVGAMKGQKFYTQDLSFLFVA